MNEIEHPLSDADRDAMVVFRAQRKAQMLAQEGKTLALLELRQGYDAMVGQTPSAAGINYEAALAGGASGFWCRPHGAHPKTAILYIHGGAYVLGSASAYQHFAGQLAARCKTAAFAVDYRLAPEHPFPAAVDDCNAAYRGLLDAGYDRIALVGDSAGGALSLATMMSARSAAVSIAPRVSVIFSPWTDLALTGASIESKAQADPIFTRAALAGPAATYLNGYSDHDPLASPLYGDLAGLPPLQVHTGSEELLLDDTIRFVDRARAAGVDATAHIWNGMPHVFPRSVDRFEAAGQALDLSAAFIKLSLY
jgi:acetyl esterase/lipase